MAATSIKSAGNPRFFPARNRIIAALSDGLLVVEAAKKSGTIITVDFALSIGKTIYAVPGRIGDPMSEGCLELIKTGSKPLTDPGDILKDFGYELKKPARSAGLRLDKKQRAVYERIKLQPKSTDEILSGLELETPEGLRILFSLELKGLIKQPLTGTYIRSGEHIQEQLSLL